MRLVVVAVGRARDAAFRALWQDYAGRLHPQVELVEVEDRKRPPPPDLKQREGRLLLDAVPAGARIVALDPRGKGLDSEELARLIGRWRDQSVGQAAFLIGGADGLDRPVLDRADLLLSLGAMTWPHQLARVMLAEQLYRAESILAGHPYHRA